MPPPGLPQPARYFPIRNNRYEVGAGFSPLGTNFGNGEQDGLHFQFDNRFHPYRDSKLTARQERLDRYYITSSDGAGLQPMVVTWLLRTLEHEAAQYFRIGKGEGGRQVLDCRLTGAQLVFEPGEGYAGGCTVQPAPRDGIDALACQVQEDIAVMTLDGGKGKLVLLHLCFPNHWSAEAKIGKSFNTLHAPVAGFENTARAAPRLMQSIMEHGPFVRHAWGLAMDDELNRHPDSPQRGNPMGRPGGVTGPDGINMRVERQVLTPLPGTDAFVFLIRTYFLNVAELSAPERTSLRLALKSMTPEQAVYKGLDRVRESVMEVLEKGCVSWGGYRRQ